MLTSSEQQVSSDHDAGSGHFAQQGEVVLPRVQESLQQNMSQEQRRACLRTLVRMGTAKALDLLSKGTNLEDEMERQAVWEHRQWAPIGRLQNGANGLHKGIRGFKGHKVTNAS